ncbi:MAG: hypothetical protein AAF266_11955 [Planctomycetota bacterium]
MSRSKKKFVSLSALALMVVSFALPSTAEARRWRRGVRVVAPRVVVAAPVRRAPVVYAPVRRSVVGYPYGYRYGVGYRGGVNVFAPGVGVSIGF